MKSLAQIHSPAHPLWQRVLALTQVLCAAFVFILSAAPGSAKAQSTACDMLSFSWNGYVGNIVEHDLGGPPEDYGTVEVFVPFGTDLSSVSPTITVSSGATVSPGSGTPQNFEGPDAVVYTVTAQDGFTDKEYDVYFFEAFSEAKMLSMSFGGTSATIGPVENGVSFVTVTLPSGTDLTTLAPTYTLSAGATCDLASGSTQDFTNAVEYTVFSSDGFESTTYVVMVTVNDPIFITAEGSGTLTFGKKPPASSWSTLSVAGAAGDITTAAGMDTAMSSITEGSINNTLADYSGAAMGPAYWRLDQLKLGTQPTGNKMTLLKSTLKNTSGGSLNGLAVSYQLGAIGTPAEQINGHRVYWSLTGNAGSWTSAGTHLQTSSGISTINFNIEFSSGWANNGNLYVVWADDNGTGTQGVFTIDQVSFTPVPPAANMLTFSAAGVAGTITGTDIYLVAPPGVDTSNLIPTFTLSNGATSNFASGVARNFSNPVLYTITSSDELTSKVYTVTIVTSDWRAGLLAQFFYLASPPSQLPDYTNLAPNLTKIDAQINYPSTNSAWAGLPANIVDNFGARHTGALYIATAGTYTIFLESDDGSKLWLNDSLLINNDGQHGMQERSATVNLTVGYHPLRVEYFEAGGGAGMILRWSGPGISKQVIPASALWRIGLALTTTTTELTSSLNPSNTSDSVTFTATLRNGGNVTTNATGTYAFRRNGAVVAVVPLVNGVATFTTSTLPSGTHIISATYSGDETYRTSDASLSQVNNTLVSLTVNNGSGDGNYISGSTASILADLPAQGKAFAGWVINSGSPVIADASSASTTLTMPNTNVTITASYKNVPPAGITALAWYDAADAETVIETGTPAKVHIWQDKSGNGYHATQTSANFRPTKETGGLRFGGTGTDVHLTLPIMAADAYTVMMVIKNDSAIGSSTANQMPLSLETYFAGPAFGSSGSALAGEVVAMTDSNAAFYYTDRQGASNTIIPSISPAHHLYSFVLTDNWHIGMDGSPNRRNLTNGVRHPMLFTEKAGAIGANVRQKPTTVEHEWVGLISEIILVPNAITVAQRQHIEGYFAWKWDAINGNSVLRDALPSDHPHKNLAPSSNTPPVAIAQSVTAEAATAKPITLTGSDADSNPLTFTIVTPPSHGQLTGTAPNVTYTANFGYSGDDSFTFKVNDGQVDSVAATVSITVEEGDPYAQWATLNGYNLIGDKTDDDDGDGLRNFDEYAFGLDPTSGASSNPVVSPLNKATHTFSYTRYAYSNLTYTVWATTDLAYWGETPAPVTEIVSEPDAKGVVTVQATLTAPPLQANKLFVRVKAE